MVDNICLFETSDYKNLLPLVYYRPVYDLKCGLITLREKAELHYNGKPFSFYCREYLTDIFRQKNPGAHVNVIEGSNCLFINGQIVVDNDFVSQVSLNGEDTLYYTGSTIVALKLSGKNLELVNDKSPDHFVMSNFAHLNQVNVSVKLISYPWELVNINGGEIASDFLLLKPQDVKDNIKGTVYDGAMLVNKDDIVILEGSKIKPGVVLDAEAGPIYIGKNVTILPNAVIEGPACIGNNSIIKACSKLYENSSIGPFCKVGGEIEASIIHSYSNKQHDGFLGHSYLGSWVNLGANTNNSDLKNNYSTIRMIINGVEIDTGSMFNGAIIGDHSKTAIGTLLNTGTIIGVSSNIFGAGFPKKFIPSFVWGGIESKSIFDLQKSIETAKRAMIRRGVEMTAADEKLFKTVFELTEQERNNLK
jgi:UDP-N-acetylglucosamine diphosphorylase/glucosamine-1-phosphate N-acetyltransferase